VSGNSAQIARRIGEHRPSESGTAARSQGWSFARLLIYAQAVHREFVDLDLAQSSLADLKLADSQSTDGEGADRERADRQRPYCQCPKRRGS